MARAQAEMKHAQDTATRMDLSAKKVTVAAATLESGTIKTLADLDTAFTHANHALALDHCAKAAAHGLESAAGWAGAEAKAGAAAAVADTKALGNKLVSGASWARDEVVKGFESLGNALNILGQKIGSSEKAEPVNVGA
ncbi:MAG: hypothetical protein ABI856_18045 [Nitrospira sp.]